MNFLHKLSSGNYKAATEEILKHILENPESLAELIEIYLSEDLMTSHRAAYTLTILSEKYEQFIIPHAQRIYNHMLTPPHDAALRNGLRFFKTMDIPEDLEGPIFDYCYKLFGIIKSPISIRVYSATVLFNIAQKYPELREELTTYFDEYKETGSPVFKRSMEKMISKLT